MEHWFDRLAQPHTRRTTLKAAALGGVGLALPLKWGVTAASASPLPCTPHCIQAAGKAAIVADDACTSRLNRRVAKGGYTGLLPGGGGGAGTVTVVLALGRFIDCYSSNSLTFHAAQNQCSEPQCGNPIQYPGTPPPPSTPGCGPGSFLCGGECCDLSYAGCEDCSSGPVCCRIGGECCPSTG